MNTKATHTNERTVFRNRNNKLIITTRRIQTKQLLINLKNIIDHGIMVRYPNRIPLFILLGLGLLFFIFPNVLEDKVYPELTFSGFLGNVSVSLQVLLQLTGIVFFISGFLMLVLFRKKYMVVVETPRGVYKIAKCDKKERAVDVEMAIHEAILYMPRDLFKQGHRSKAKTPDKNGKKYVNNGRLENKSIKKSDSKD